MNKLQIRTRCVTETGRYELVGTAAGATDFTTNNGIDEYIEQGQQLVYDMLPDLLSEETWTSTLVIGTYQYAPTRLKVPRRVGIFDTDGNRMDLEVISMHQMEHELGTDFASSTAGTPQWATFDLSTTPYANPAILYVLPVTDTAYTIEVRGLFYPPSATLHTDTTWLMTWRPFLLIKATNYAIALSYGHDVELREKAFMDQVRLVDFDGVHRDVSEAVDDYGYIQIEETYE